MDGFVQRVRQRLSDLGALTPGARLIAATSGGADSVAMVRALCELSVGAVVAHVDHQQRVHSAADAEFCERLAQQHGLEYVGLKCVPANGSEDAMRQARYEALARVEGDWLLTAHTRDDQAETVLMRLLRGTGTAGLAGIPLRRGRIVRPMLDVTRAEVVAFLASLGQPHQKDCTNDSPDPMRNRVRHRLLPMLREEFQPNVDSALVRLAEAARSDREFLEDSARDHLAVHGLELSSLRAAHPGLLPHILREASEVPIPTERMRALRRLVAGDGGAVQLEGGVTVRIERQRAKGLRNQLRRLVFTSSAACGHED